MSWETFVDNLEAFIDGSVRTADSVSWFDESSGDQWTRDGGTGLTETTTPAGNPALQTASSTRLKKTDDYNAWQFGASPFYTCGLVYIDAASSGTYDTLFSQWISPNKHVLLWRRSSDNKLEWWVSADGTTSLLTVSDGTVPDDTSTFYEAFFDPDADEVCVSVNRGTDAISAFTGPLHTGGSVQPRIFQYTAGTSYLEEGSIVLLVAKEIPSSADRDWLYNSGSFRSYEELMRRQVSGGGGAGHGNTKSRLYQEFSESGDYAWTLTDNDGSASISGGVLTLSHIGTGSGATAKVVSDSPGAARDTHAILILHDVTWSVPASPTGNEGRIRNQIRNFDDTAYLESAWYVKPVDDDTHDVEIRIVLDATDGLQWTILADYDEGTADLTLTIKRYSILYQTDLEDIYGTGSGGGGTGAYHPLAIPYQFGP